MYLKDVNFKDNKIKSNLIVLFKSSDELSHIENEFYANEGNSFDDELDVRKNLFTFYLLRNLSFIFNRVSLR